MNRCAPRCATTQSNAGMFCGQPARFQRGGLLCREGRVEQVGVFLVAAEQVNDEVQPVGQIGPIRGARPSGWKERAGGFQAGAPGPLCGWSAHPRARFYRKKVKRVLNLISNMFIIIIQILLP